MRLGTVHPESANDRDRGSGHEAGSVDCPSKAAGMAQRSQDWWRQAQRDLETAVDTQASGRHEWACFASHQAAEKAVKALHLACGQEAWGPVVARLLRDLPTPASEELIASGKVLDNFYVPTRYPDGHPEGAPFEHYGPIQSELAVSHARNILNFVDQALAQR